jgi:hypothetical protein
MEPSIPRRGLACNKTLAKWQLAKCEFGEMGNIIWRNGNWRNGNTPSQIIPHAANSDCPNISLVTNAGTITETP